MKELSITNLAKILNAGCEHRGSGGERRATSDEARINGVSTDSRTVKPGDCFFAITGLNFDGHNYVAEAFAKGASCAVVNQSFSIRNPQSEIRNPILVVLDTVKALGDLAAWYRRECSFKVVAITGSVGKTTTRQIAHHVLSQRFRTCQSPKNYNNFIGLPMSILAAPPDSQILVLELATNHPGEIEYLSKIAAPDIALITNVHPAHLAGFGSIEKIAEEKLSIYKGLSPNGMLIINGDYPCLLDAANKLRIPFKTFSFFPSADFPTRNFVLGPLGIAFTIDNTNVTLGLPGRGALENALAAWAICSTLGVSSDDFAEAVKTISPISMRTEMLQIGSLTVINDCYNANPASMKNALEILARLSGAQDRRSVFICGDMAELGESENALHQALGKQIADAGVNILITMGPLAGVAADAAKQAKPGIQTHKFTACDDLCNNLLKVIGDCDIILVKGSRINKLETVVEKLKDLVKRRA